MEIEKILEYEDIETEEIDQIKALDFLNKSFDICKNYLDTLVQLGYNASISDIPPLTPDHLEELTNKINKNTDKFIPILNKHFAKKAGESLLVYRVKRFFNKKN